MVVLLDSAAFCFSNCCQLARIVHRTHESHAVSVLALVAGVGYQKKQPDRPVRFK